MTSHLLSGTDSTVSLLSAAGGVDLDLDLSFIGQMVAFALLIIILKPLLFDPLLRLFEERERRTEGTKLVARKLDEKAGDLLRRYEAEVAAVRKTAGADRDRIRAEGLKVEAQILAETRAETTKLIEEGKARITKEASVIRAELAVGADELARSVASRVLGREVS